MAVKCNVCKSDINFENNEDFKRQEVNDGTYFKNGQRYAEGREKRKVLKIASWNLKMMTKEKIQNKGVLNVICMTILENR